MYQSLFNIAVAVQKPCKNKHTTYSSTFFDCKLENGDNNIDCRHRLSITINLQSIINYYLAAVV